MDSGIGAPRSSEGDGLVQDGGKSLLYFSLDGDLSGLDLPTGVRGAVIFNGDFEIFPGLGHGPLMWRERLQPVAWHIGQHGFKVVIHELFVFFLGKFFATGPAA
jgi:hypothetical protein